VSTDETDAFVDAFFGEGARASDGCSSDWRLNSISNYTQLDVGEVPAYLKDIVKVERYRQANPHCLCDNIPGWVELHGIAGQGLQEYISAAAQVLGSRINCN